MKRLLKRFSLSLAAGVLLVPVVSGGALAADQYDGVHVKEARGISHVRASDDVAPDVIALDADHRSDDFLSCDPLVETDHPPFATEDEHKAFHGIPTEIDHESDPEFSSAAEHKAYHGIPCGVGDVELHDSGSEDEHRAFHEADVVTPDDDVERLPHAEGDRPGTEVVDPDGSTDDSATDDGTADAGELKEQPHESTSESTGDDADRSRRDEESRDERSD